MPRKRVGTVNESLEELGALEDRYRGKPEEVRITVLKLLKEDEERGIEDVANMVGYSKPTVKRWWRSYREGGLDKLLGIAVPTRPAPEVDENLNVLKQKLIAGEFANVEDVRGWIDNRPRLSETRNVAHLSTNQLIKNSGIRRNNVHRDLDASTSQTIDKAYIQLERLLAFLSSLPSTHIIKDWTDAFRSSLQVFLGDVDRVSISVNARCDLQNPMRYKPNLIISQSVHTGAKAINPLTESTEDNKDESMHLERFLGNLRSRKFPFSMYQAPVCFVYYYLGYAFLGVIVLWREHSKPPISEQTIMMMEKLHSFLTFVLSDFAARHQAATPVEHVFDMALEGLAQESGLTMQERRIMILQLLGLSYEETATTLSISLNTVRYHLRSIYQKTGTHSQAELFAKYFTPRYDPEHPSQ